MHGPDTPMSPPISTTTPVSSTVSSLSSTLSHYTILQVDPTGFVPLKFGCPYFNPNQVDMHLSWTSLVGWVKFLW